MQQGIIQLFLCASVLFLGGCTSVNASLENYVEKKSKIEDSDDYKQYIKLKEGGNLDDEGKYIAPETTAVTEQHDGQVHITFTRNSYMNVNYYSDESKTELLDQNGCYLNPGDSIYADVTVNNPNNALYKLDHYQITYYDANGNAGEQIDQALDGNLVYQIPDPVDENEINIAPIGRYDDQQVTLKGYVISEDGNTSPASNEIEWFVDDDPVTSSEPKLSAYDAYTVSFDFDRSNYYFDHSDPEIFTDDTDQAAKIEFYKVSPSDDSDNYSVWIRKCVSFSIRSSGKSTSYQVNNGAENFVSSGTWKDVTKLKNGDVVTVKTDGGVDIKGTSYPELVPGYEAGSGVNTYTFTVNTDSSKKSSEDDFNKLGINIITGWQIELNPGCPGGTCNFTVDGKEESGNLFVEKGQKVTVKCNPDKDHKFPGNGPAVAKDNLLGREVEVPEEDIQSKKTIMAGDYFDLVSKDVSSDSVSVDLDLTLKHAKVTCKLQKNLIQTDAISDAVVEVNEGQNLQVTVETDQGYELSDGKTKATKKFSYDELKKNPKIKASDIFTVQEKNGVLVYLDTSCEKGTCTFALKKGISSTPITDDHVKVSKGQKLVVTCPSDKSEDSSFWNKIKDHVAPKSYEIKYEELQDDVTVHASDYCDQED